MTTNATKSGFARFLRDFLWEIRPFSALLAIHCQIELKHIAGHSGGIEILQHLSSGQRTMGINVFLWVSKGLIT